jgi:hypothetical protein
MSLVIDFRKMIRYPPELFMSALPTDLIAGENIVATYINPDPYVLILQGLSFSRASGISFRADVDGMTDVVRLDNLGSSRGIDYEERIKIPVTRLATLKFFTQSATAGYAWRHKLLVMRPTTAMKLQLGMRLSPDDVDLATKYDLQRMLALSTPQAFDIYSGVEDYKTVMVKLSSSGTVARLTVPQGKKYILLGVSALRPSASAQAYLNIERDDLLIQTYDLYTLPGLEQEASLRIVALDKLVVSLDVRASGTYYVRLVYGIGRLTLREKIMWGLELSSTERALAEQEDLFNKVRAGVV